MNIAILGAGMVGRAIALDLAKKHQVSAFDISDHNLSLLKERNPSIHTQTANLKAYEGYFDLLQPFDLVVTAVPGFMGFHTLEAVIRAGKSVADISFFPENALDLDGLAKEKGVTVITDCGVAPGMSNYIIGRYNETMTVKAFEIYVGGLPALRKKPFEYKAPFSPVDVIEEYTRPARLMENGHIVTRQALSEREWMHFGELGTLEAFNTDGLRSLLFTMPHIPNQKEKTLRYPGHADLIIALRESGFFSHSPIDVKGQSVVPLEFTSKVLFDEWKLGEEEHELTIMKVVVHGEDRGRARSVEYDLLDRYDPATKISSMSRTTGYTCTASAELILQGLFREKGVFPPERVGSHESCFRFVVDYLSERGIQWKKKEFIGSAEPIVKE
jgi:saccharopine dehydrogenase-like NADP-dependent oxidoreductase